jgi:hypothetical protein
MKGGVMVFFLFVGIPVLAFVAGVWLLALAMPGGSRNVSGRHLALVGVISAALPAWSFFVQGAIPGVIQPPGTAPKPVLLLITVGLAILLLVLLCRPLIRGTRKEGWAALAAIPLPLFLVYYILVSQPITVL